jgi:hypothetical protein
MRMNSVIEVIEKCYRARRGEVILISSKEAAALNQHQMDLGFECISWSVPGTKVYFCGHDIALNRLADAYGEAHDR